jgi:hypothetical protein
VFSVFREWHRREHPRSGYRVKPRVWTAHGLQGAEGKSELERINRKNCEPTLTGIAFTDRHVYLVLALSELDAAGVGRMLYLSYLFRHDPDFIEHGGKHAHRVILARTASEQMIQFARGYRIGVVRLETEQAAPETGPQGESNDRPFGNLSGEGHGAS